MNLTKTQKMILYAFRRTGTATKGDMRRETIRYAPALKALIKRGILVELKDGSYGLTVEGRAYMPGVLEEDL